MSLSGPSRPIDSVAVVTNINIHNISYNIIIYLYTV